MALDQECRHPEEKKSLREEDKKEEKKSPPKTCYVLKKRAEFLDIRKPTGGDVNRKCINLHHGVVIPDKFMEIIHRATHEEGFDDSWELIDPHTQEVKKVVSARTLWVKLLQNRMETGEPYLMFEDAVNAELPDFQKRK